MRMNRKRYVLFKLHRRGPKVTGKQLSTTLWNSILSLFGEVSTSDSRLFIDEGYDENTGVGFLQCNAASLNNVLAAAAVIDSIGKTKVSFQSKKTSGTIKGLRK
ncbi:MAG: Rpp14/Pop5 family protein [Candidatus Thorarchaeota archaeon]|jgi:RNase P/RNase MRP subunit POP5